MLSKSKMSENTKHEKTPIDEAVSDILSDMDEPSPPIEPSTTTHFLRPLASRLVDLIVDECQKETNHEKIRFHLVDPLLVYIYQRVRIYVLIFLVFIMLLLVLASICLFVYLVSLVRSLVVRIHR